jgi:hypothetical protein
MHVNLQLKRNAYAKNILQQTYSIIYAWQYSMDEIHMKNKKGSEIKNVDRKDGIAALKQACSVF